MPEGGCPLVAAGATRFDFYPGMAGILSCRRSAFDVVCPQVFASGKARRTAWEGAACLGNAPWARYCLFITLLACWSFGAIPLLHAALPHIELIDLYGTNQVTIHFPTEANRTYMLQFTDDVPGEGATATKWTTLYTPPRLPFSNHYVVADTRTRARRFYRLVATP